jgi:hypothetical protein
VATSRASKSAEVEAAVEATIGPSPCGCEDKIGIVHALLPQYVSLTPLRAYHSPPSQPKGARLLGRVLAHHRQLHISTPCPTFPAVTPTPAQLNPHPARPIPIPSSDLPTRVGPDLRRPSSAMIN